MLLNVAVRRGTNSSPPCYTGGLYHSQTLQQLASTTCPQQDCAALLQVEARVAIGDEHCTVLKGQSLHDIDIADLTKLGFHFLQFILKPDNASHPQSAAKRPAATSLRPDGRRRQTVQEMKHAITTAALHEGLPQQLGNQQPDHHARNLDQPTRLAVDAAQTREHPRWSNRRHTTDSTRLAHISAPAADNGLLTTSARLARRASVGRVYLHDYARPGESLRTKRICTIANKLLAQYWTDPLTFGGSESEAQAADKEIFHTLASILLDFVPNHTQMQLPALFVDAALAVCPPTAVPPTRQLCEHAGRQLREILAKPSVQRDCFKLKRHIKQLQDSIDDFATIAHHGRRGTFSALPVADEREDGCYCCPITAVVTAVVGWFQI